MAKFLLFIYKILSITFLPIVIIIVFFRVLQGKEISYRIKERFGFSSTKRPSGNIIWINASSIGEYLATVALIKKIRRTRPRTKILLTTNTKTSAILAKKITDKNIIHQFTPQDNILFIKKFLDYWKPSLVIWMESEFWPIILDETKKNDVEIILLNGRLSDSSFKNWNYFKFIFKEIISNFSLILAMSKIDETNFKNLGARRTSYIGNLKFSNQKLHNERNKEIKIKKIISKRKVWLAASTHKDEENLVARLHLKLKKRKQFQNLLTVIVPRNIKRSKKIKKEISSLIKNTELFSSKLISKKTEIIIDESIGQLEVWYRNIKTVFLGKSIPPKGGQNPIEPAKNGCTIISGKMSNFKEIQNEMLAKKSILIVSSVEQLEKKILDSVEDLTYTKKIRANAKKYVNSKSYILDHTIKAIKKYLI